MYPGRGLHGQIVAKIGTRIVDGTYPPGDTIRPEQLEHELAVSKTAVREALKVLAAKGLVDSRQKRGTFVRPRSEWSLMDPDLLHWRQLGGPDEAFLNDLNEVRLIVEPAGARLAAARRTDEDLAVLTVALEAMGNAGKDAEAVIAADLCFHRMLLAAAHNELLARMEVVIEAGLRERDRLVHAGEQWPNSVPAHERVLQAVAAKDPAAASEAMLVLLQQASTDVSRLRRTTRSPARRGRRAQPR